MAAMYLFVLDDDPPTHLLAEVAEVQDDPLEIALERSAVVRFWGTTAGRGQLCLDGPQQRTITDEEPSGGAVCRLHLRRRILVTKGAVEKWKKRLGWS